MEFWQPGETYALSVSGSAGAYAWIHATSGSLVATADGSQASACVNAWYSSGGASVHAAEWVAPATAPSGGACVVFSTAQATGSTAAYNTNLVSSFDQAWSWCQWLK